MKKIILILAFTLAGLTPTYGEEILRITSAPGMTQQAWQETEQYKSFDCPKGTLGGGGVDMNFTTDRSDDTYFAYCYTADILQSTQSVNTQPTEQIQLNFTETKTIETNQTNTTTITTTSTITPAPQIQPKQETATVTTNNATVTIVETPTVTTESATVITTKTTTATTDPYDFSKFDWNSFWTWFTAWYQQIYGVKP